MYDPRNKNRSVRRRCVVSGLLDRPSEAEVGAVHIRPVGIQCAFVDDNVHRATSHLALEVYPFSRQSVRCRYRVPGIDKSQKVRIAGVEPADPIELATDAAHEVNEPIQGLLNRRYWSSL